MNGLSITYSVETEASFLSLLYRSIRFRIPEDPVKVIQESTSFSPPQFTRRTNDTYLCSIIAAQRRLSSADAAQQAVNVVSGLLRNPCVDPSLDTDNHPFFPEIKQYVIHSQNGRIDVCLAR